LAFLGALSALGGLGLGTRAEAFWDFGGKKAPEKKSVRVAMIDLSGAYPDRAPSSGFLSSRKSYQRLLRRIRTARKSPDVKAVIFRLGGLQVGLAKAEAIHNAILSLKKAGKTTIALVEAGASADYVVALACEKIYMPSSGMLLLPGLRSESLYFKKLMDRFGLVGDFLTLGDFKTAPEPFLRESMSDAQRRQVTALIDDLYTHLVGVIAKLRKLPEAKVKEAIDQGLLTPADAKARGLIDGISYLAEIQKMLKEQYKGEEVVFVPRFAIKKKEPPTSLWSFFSMLVQPKKQAHRPDAPKIAVVYLNGNIMHGSPPPSLFGSEGEIWSDRVIKTLEEVRKVKNLRAVILRINSPGGSALASDMIWKKLEQLKRKNVPLYASMGNVAASGGYYIAMGADVILAQPTTITGSIGIFAGKVVLRDAFQKLGIHIESISRGQNSGMFSAFERFSASERKVLIAMLESAYDDFLAKAAQGRKMAKEELKKHAGGRVWTGRQALQHKLIDQLGDLRDAIQLAIQRTGLKKAPQVLVYPRPKTFFEALQEVSSRPQESLPYASSPVMTKLLEALKLLPAPLAAPLRFLLQHQASPHQIIMYQSLPSIQLR
jgi:protease-4